MNIDGELESALLEAYKSATEVGNIPDNMWHPNYGWIIYNGSATENTQKFLEDMENKKCP